MNATSAQEMDLTTGVEIHEESSHQSHSQGWGYKQESERECGIKKERKSKLLLKVMEQIEISKREEKEGGYSSPNPLSSLLTIGHLDLS